MRKLPERICGKPFSEQDLITIKQEIDQAEPKSRAEIARKVCRALQWYDVTGKPKLMSARKALLRLHRDRYIVLPRPRNGNGNQKKPVYDSTECLKKERITGTVSNLSDLYLEAVNDKEKSNLFNALVGKYHYLGYRPLPGAQLRYLIRTGESILGAISFSGAAWKVAVRDEWIGWLPEVRERHLNGIINNTRFLILPWIEVKNLASKVLALAVKRLKTDMPDLYGYCPVLLETFVDTERFRGTCYQAANWIKLGQTKGRGRGDRLHRAKIPVKDVYVYPLKRNFRKLLGGANG